MEWRYYTNYNNLVDILTCFVKIQHYVISSCLYQDFVQHVILYGRDFDVIYSKNNQQITVFLQEGDYCFKLFKWNDWSYWNQFTSGFLSPLHRCIPVCLFFQNCTCPFFLLTHPDITLRKCQNRARHIKTYWYTLISINSDLQLQIVIVYFHYHHTVLSLNNIKRYTFK